MRWEYATTRSTAGRRSSDLDDPVGENDAGGVLRGRYSMFMYWTSEACATECLGRLGLVGAADALSASGGAVRRRLAGLCRGRSRGQLPAQAHCTLPPTRVRLTDLLREHARLALLVRVRHAAAGLAGAGEGLGRIRRRARAGRVLAVRADLDGLLAILRGAVLGRGDHCASGERVRVCVRASVGARGSELTVAGSVVVVVGYRVKES